MNVQRGLELAIVAAARESAAVVDDITPRMEGYVFGDIGLGWIWQCLHEIAREHGTPGRSTIEARAAGEAEAAQPALLELIAEVWNASPSTAPHTDVETLHRFRRQDALVKVMTRATHSLTRGDLDEAEDIFRRAASSPHIGEAAPPLRPLSLTALLQESDGLVEWDVETIIARSTGTSLSGLAGAGKTWLLLDLAIEAARGGRWLGKFQCTPGCVVYIDEESRERLRRQAARTLLKRRQRKSGQ